MANALADRTRSVLQQQGAGLPRERFTQEFAALFAYRLRVICLLGVVFIPAFGLLDAVFLAWLNPSSALVTILLLRVAIGVYYLLLWLVLRNGALSSRSLIAIEWAMFPVAALLATYVGVRAQGIDTAYFAGVILVIVARCIYVPGGIVHTALSCVGAWAAYPATVALMGAAQEGVGEQFSDPARVAGFVGNNILIASFVVIGVLGSAIINRLQLQEYRLKRVGRYEILRKLGEGGMGAVYLARHGVLKCYCALKVLRGKREVSPVGRARFVQEARATSNLDHPNTIRIFDFGESDDGALFYTMEYLEGFDLRTLVAQTGPVPPERAVHFGMQICRSLEQAHANRLIHRDIKPENCFALGGQSEPDFIKVLDFGLAKFLRETGDGTPRLSRVGSVLGTPHYMAPELCLGLEVDARTDIYSLGGLLYFLLTGRPAFTAPSQLEVMMAQMREPPVPPRVHRPDVPVDLEAVILRCMAKPPQDRYGSAAETHDALAACACAGAWTRERAAEWWQAQPPSPDPTELAHAGPAPGAAELVGAPISLTSSLDGDSSDAALAAGADAILSPSLDDTLDAHDLDRRVSPRTPR